MFIRQLVYLSTLAEERHFGRAAAACHVSQPALSGAIQKLEQELGVLIVQRGQRFEGFTCDGERILLWARRILADCEALKQAAHHNAQALTGSLRLGSIPTALPLIPFFIEACLLAHTQVQHQVYTMAATDLLRKLHAFELDLGLGYLDEQHDPQFETLALFQERYVLVARHRDYFHGRQDMHWADVAQLPLCLLTPNMQSRRGIDQAFLRAGSQATPVLESDSLTILCSHVQQLGLYSILPHSVFCLSDITEHLVALPLRPHLYRQIGVITRAGHPHAPLLQAALHLFQRLNLQDTINALTPNNG